MDSEEIVKGTVVYKMSASGNDFYSYSSVQGVGYPAADPNSCI